MKKLIKKLLNRKEEPLMMIDDGFINHLTYVNPGFLHRGNLHLFDFAIRNIPENSHIVEIGVFCGLSTNAISYFCEVNNKNNIKIFNTDIWQLYTFNKYNNIGQSKISHVKYREYLIQTYKNNIEFFFGKDSIHTFDLNSDSFFEGWINASIHHDIWGRQIQLGGNVGFAYVDGSHLYDQVKRDFLNVKKILCKGGFVLFDDSADGVYIKNDCEVSLLMNEITKNYADEFELVCKNPNYLFKRK